MDNPKRRDFVINLVKKYQKKGVPIMSKPKEEAARELATELQGKGLVYSSPIVALRQHFNLDICLRPCYSYNGNPLNFIRRGQNGTIEDPLVDVAIFRQNTEGLYGGVEWSNPPEKVYDALLTHSRFVKNFGNVPREELSVSTRIFTRKATERILRAAFNHARKYNYRSVTLCEKLNVIRETSGMMYKMASEIQKNEFPEIELWNTNIDAQMMWLTKNPENYGVLVAGNMFGDIVSDAFAGLIGGLGFACSAQINPDTGVAIFEPTHGSAPKYAGYPVSIVNPIAMIESACMMLDYLDLQKMAHKRAVVHIVREAGLKVFIKNRRPLWRLLLVKTTVLQGFGTTPMDNLNTDQMFPGHLTYQVNSANPAAIVPHLFQDFDPGFSRNVKKGDLLICGNNFGCGSSREHPAVGLRHAGVDAVIVKSVSRIFFRSAVNQGLPIIVLPKAVDAYRRGDKISIDFEKGTLAVGEKYFGFSPLPVKLLRVLQAGGLVKSMLK